MRKLTKILAAMMLMTAVVFAVGCKPEDEPDNRAVDLGLPSGTLWASCNVGANAPEEYGDYFAWGETEPKASYSWSNYKYGKGTYDQLIKYCNDSNYGYEGFVDNLSELEPSDDAATVNWGNGWYTPTVEQWEELTVYTDYAWTVWNGVIGAEYTGPNGNKIFVPCAGYRREGVTDWQGKDVYFWASSLATDDDYNPDHAWYYYHSINGDRFSGYRCWALPVRPVRSSR